MSVSYCKWCEIFHEGWMFCDSEFCHDAKKWAIADVLSGKNIFSTVNPSYNKLWKCYEILFDTIKVRNKKVKDLSILYVFLIPCLLSSRGQLVIAWKFLCMSFSFHGWHIATLEKMKSHQTFCKKSNFGT